MADLVTALPPCPFCGAPSILTTFIDVPRDGFMETVGVVRGCSAPCAESQDPASWVDLARREGNEVVQAYVDAIQPT